MGKFRIPKKLYQYSVEEDIIHTYDYSESRRDGRIVYHCVNSNTRRIVEKDSIVFATYDIPNPAWHWSLFASIKMCKMFRKKVLEFKIEIINNKIKDRMYTLEMFSNRVAMDCEVV